MSNLVCIQAQQAGGDGRKRQTEGGGVVPGECWGQELVDAAIKLVADQQSGDDILSAAIAPFGRGQDRRQMIARVAAKLGSVVGIEGEVVVEVDRPDQGAV